MRQFILATGFNASKEAAAEGNVYISQLREGEKLGLNFGLKRATANGGDILYPFYPKDFTYTKAVYSGATQFVAKYTIETIEPYVDYTFLFMQKGKQFNERSKWTATVHTTPTDTPATLLAKIKKFVDANTALGLTATVDANTITFKGSEKGEDYAILPSDEIMGLQPAEEIVKGKPVFMDAEMVKDLAAKCAADAGFEYTYGEGETMYPNFLKDPLAQPNAEDTGFTVYTMRFTEPRVMATRDDAVYQIVQVAFATGKDTGFEEAIKVYVETVNETATADAVNE